MGNELAGEMNAKLDDISEEIADVKSDIAAVKQDVLDAIQSSANALTELMKSSQVEIIKKITEEAAQTQEDIRVFRELAQTNHDNLIFEIKEAQFEDHYLQCLEWSTNILAKYKIYDMVMENVIDKRKAVLERSPNHEYKGDESSACL